MAGKRRRRRAKVERLLLLIIREPDRLLQLAVGEQDLALRLTRRARLLGRLADSLERLGVLHTLPGVAVDQLTSAKILA